MSRAERAPLAGPLDARLRPMGLTLGQVAFGALVVAVSSGVVLGLAYDPAEPLRSTEAISGALPFGFLFRGAHILSAQLFFVSLLLHTADHVLGRSYRQVSRLSWWRLVLVGLGALGAMFSGFLLRGDADARAAQAIAAAGLKVVPMFGADISLGLLGEPGGGLQAPYVHHLVTFTLAPWLLSLAHARRAWAGALVTGAVAALTTGAALVYHPGPGLPSDLHRGVLWGPWYFMGAQELLRHLPLGVVVLVLGGGAVGLTGGLAHTGGASAGRRGRVEAAMRSAWLLAVGGYLLLCLASYLARSGK